MDQTSFIPEDSQSVPQVLTLDSVSDAAMAAHHRQRESQRLPLPKPDPGSAAILRDELQTGGF